MGLAGSFQGPGYLLKRPLDFLGSCLLLVLASPFLALTAVTAAIS